MPKMVILGSSNAIPDELHENTHMALVGNGKFVLIDCPGNPVVRLKKAGLDLDQLTDIILTHFHPDHVSGIALLLMDLWLLGRKRGLRISGLNETLSRFEQLMNLYGWDDWPGIFPLQLNHLPEEEMAFVLEDAEWRIFASPVLHLIPNIGLRIESTQSGKVLAYSSDTEPCTQVVRLAYRADILIHESAGANHGHSDSSQAAAIAHEAGINHLYLIHYPTGNFRDETILTRASAYFDGPVFLAEDLMEIDF
jgi:ribonuclease Z